MNANPNLEINTVEDEIFMKSYIPTTLEEVIDIDRDTLIVEQGEGNNLVYADLLGTGVTKSIQQLNIDDDSEEEENQKDSNEDNSEEEGDSEEDHDSDFDENGERKPRLPRGKKNEDKDDKKERKQKTKEEARERRKHKLPKAEKKRKIKTSCKKKK
jgi:RIO kinase 1